MDKHHLKDRVPGRIPLRVQRLHKLFKGQVLVVKGPEHDLTDLFEQILEGWIAPEVGAQHQGVDEEADEPFQLAPGAPRHRRADGEVADEVQSLLAEFDVEALPALVGIIGVIKYCSTPDGKGVHMVLNSERGLVTVIYMPDTPVTDRKAITFDDREALLVALKSGSAAIIGSPQQRISDLYALIQDSIVPIPGTT